MSLFKHHADTREEYVSRWLEYMGQFKNVFYHAGYSPSGYDSWLEEVKEVINTAADNVENFGGFEDE